MRRLRNDPVRLEGWKKKKREYADKHRKLHPFKKLASRLLAEKGWNVNPIELWKLAKRQQLICPISGRRLTSQNISVDHIIALTVGGKNELSNIQLTTKEVNVAKHILATNDFIKLCEDITNYQKVKRSETGKSSRRCLERRCRAFASLEWFISNSSPTDQPTLRTS